jgi:hypothetical protein
MIMRPTGAGTKASLAHEGRVFLASMRSGSVADFRAAWHDATSTTEAWELVTCWALMGSTVAHAAAKNPKAIVRLVFIDAFVGFLPLDLLQALLQALDHPA